MSREAVAVWLMKVAMNRQMIPVPTMSGKGDHSAKGMEPIRFFASPVSCRASPRAKPPATSQSTSQPIFFKSSLVMVSVMAKTAMGIMAMVLESSPCTPLPVTHSRTVTAKVT